MNAYCNPKYVTTAICVPLLLPANSDRFNCMSTVYI